MYNDMENSHFTTAYVGCFP